MKSFKQKVSHKFIKKHKIGAHLMFYYILNYNQEININESKNCTTQKAAERSALRHFYLYLN